MKHIKLFENIINIGGIYKICKEIPIVSPKNASKIIVIAKFIKFIDLNKNWGYLDGYIIYPEYYKSL